MNLEEKQKMSAAIFPSKHYVDEMEKGNTMSDRWHSESAENVVVRLDDNVEMPLRGEKI